MAAKDAGIAGLPKKWALVVQLVGTFGLAVFLVLYYVLIVQPREAKRYDSLRDSLTALKQVVEAKETLLPREQAANLEELFILATSTTLAELIASELKGNPAKEALARSIEDQLIVETRRLQGLMRNDGGNISEQMTHKIRNSNIALQLAERALAGWTNLSHLQITKECRSGLDFAIRRAAMAK